MAAKVHRVGPYKFNGIDGIAYIFQCPACKYGHQFVVPPWKFNGDLEKPTVTGSVMVDRDRPEKICHSNITDGRIMFHGDSHHALKGQTVELEDWEG